VIVEGHTGGNQLEGNLQLPRNVLLYYHGMGRSQSALIPDQNY
jgi:hypothetical protein